MRGEGPFLLTTHTSITQEEKGSQSIRSSGSRETNGHVVVNVVIGVDGITIMN